jgi:serine/threonine protein kinase
MHQLARLRHPCITTVMGAVLGDSDMEEPMLVMELMQLGSLRDLLNNDTLVLEGDIVQTILRDVVQGMRFLHAASPPIVHGDLKAANVLVDESFRAKVSDFGLNQKLGSDGRGSRYWMAPEVIAGGKPSTASDVYAFGITLYEMFSRRTPYEGRSPGAVLDLVKAAGGLRPEIPEACPPLVEAMMIECWQHDPALRPSFEALGCRVSIVSLDQFTSHLLAKVSQRQAHPAGPATGSFLQRDRADRRANLVLHDVFPRHVAEALVSGRKVEPEFRDSVTIFFSDVVGFTTISASLRPEKVPCMCNVCIYCIK